MSERRSSWKKNPEGSEGHWTVYTTITCLTVNPKNALETLGHTVQFRPVVELDELVVFHPGRQLGKAQVVPVLH